MNNANLERLIKAARQLRPLLGELVFVGGAVTGLLVTDDDAGEPRTTSNVNAIAKIRSYDEYLQFGERLRGLRFLEDTRPGTQLCRWENESTLLDVMPVDEKVIGFSNRWYEPAMETAQPHRLAEGLEVRVITAPFFLASKLEAYLGRGELNLFSSRDLEDIVYVLGGRLEAVEEVRRAPPELLAYVRDQVGAIVGRPDFRKALQRHLRPDPSRQARTSRVLQRLNELAAL